jgi:Ankyrin repeats (3 copies)
MSRKYRNAPNAQSLQDQLSNAIKDGNLELVYDLVNNKGADVNQVDSVNITPMIWAISENEPKIVDFLIQSGTQLTEASCGNLLSYARECGHKAVQDVLLANGAPDDRTNKGCNPVTGQGCGPQFNSRYAAAENACNPYTGKGCAPQSSRRYAGVIQGCNSMTGEGCGQSSSPYNPNSYAQPMIRGYSYSPYQQSGSY